MEHRFDRIDSKLDKLLDNVGDHRERLAALETKQKGFISILAALLVASVSWVFNKLHI
jgi:hypothetical protein